MSTWGDIIADSLREIGVYNPIDTLSDEDAAQGARRLNRITDSWSARKAFAYSTQFVEYTLTAGHGPTLIGPSVTSPEFATPGGIARPIRIESASLTLTDQTPYVDLPLNIRDRAWWANERVKTLQSNVPTDLYYEPLFPNGQLNFWPVPSYNYSALLEMWVAVSQIPLTSAGLPNFAAAFTTPPGYELAMVLTLAEHQATPYGKPIPQDLVTRAADARRACQMNNLASPQCSSADWGTRGRNTGSRADFNWADGLPG